MQKIQGNVLLNALYVFHWFRIMMQGQKIKKIRMLYYSVMTETNSEKKFRVLLSGVEPKTLRLLVRMLYH